MSMLHAMGWTRLNPLVLPTSFAGLLHRLTQGLLLVKHLGGFLGLALNVSFGDLRIFLFNHPEILFKALGNYLTWGLSVADRLAVLMHHYQFIALAPVGQIRALADEGSIIWCHQVGDDCFSMVLRYSDGFYMEGELALSYVLNSEKIYNIAFSVAPGAVTGLEVDRVILIGASQGVSGGAAQTRLAAKANGEIAPADMLLIAIRAIAAAWDIPAVVAISCQEQVALQVRAKPEDYHCTYDDLWESNGGVQKGNFYLFPAQLVEKPITLVSRSHRSRARRKRSLKQDIFNAVVENVRELWMARTIPVPLAPMQPVPDPREDAGFGLRQELDLPHS
jgi:uncharacterized protein VirK/YbjX